MKCNIQKFIFNGDVIAIVSNPMALGPQWRSVVPSFMFLCLVVLEETDEQTHAQRERQKELGFTVQISGSQRIFRFPH